MNRLSTNANDWQSDHAGTPKGAAHYYYPGGNAGGPIPFTNKKLLIWGGYERILQNTGNANVLQSFVPTTDMTGGNFGATSANSAFCAGTGGISSTQTNGYNDLTGRNALPALDFMRSDVLDQTGAWRQSKSAACSWQGRSTGHRDMRKPLARGSWPGSMPRCWFGEKFRSRSTGLRLIPGY